MFKALGKFLDIQELDMQMIRLMRLKSQRKKELENINISKNELKAQVIQKEQLVVELKKEASLLEEEIVAVNGKIKKFESQQNSIKKLDELNAFSQQMSLAEREKVAKESALGALSDRIESAEEALDVTQKRLESFLESRKVLEEEIYESILRINQEGRSLKAQRDQLVADADPEVFKIYERLLKNKKDRVLVPIENRCCSGCHIMLTAEDENLVRKGERLVFCEHCSRIHYWQESQEIEGTSVATKQRRKKVVKAA